MENWTWVHSESSTDNQRIGIKSKYCKFIKRSDLMWNSWDNNGSVIFDVSRPEPLICLRSVRSERSCIIYEKLNYESAN